MSSSQLRGDMSIGCTCRATCRSDVEKFIHCGGLARKNPPNTCIYVVGATTVFGWGSAVRRDSHNQSWLRLSLCIALHHSTSVGRVSKFCNSEMPNIKTPFGGRICSCESCLYVTLRIRFKDNKTRTSSQAKALSSCPALPCPFLLEMCACCSPAY